jgi:hypothetical protein
MSPSEPPDGDCATGARAEHLTLKRDLHGFPDPFPLAKVTEHNNFESDVKHDSEEC